MTKLLAEVFNRYDALAVAAGVTSGPVIGFA
jgi:hypothetical protein